MPNSRYDNDEDHIALTIEEIAAEAHRHRNTAGGATQTSNEPSPSPTPPPTPPQRTAPAAAATAQKQAAGSKLRIAPPSPSTTRPTAPTDPFASLAIHSYDAYDDDLLHRAVADAGRWAYGTVLVEVWVQHGTSLVRPPSGWWLDPVYHAQPCGIESCQLCRLTDKERPDYVAPAPLIPGEGLPGALWAELQGGTTSNRRRLVLSNRGGSTRGGGASSRAAGGHNTTSRSRGIFSRIQQQHQEKLHQQEHTLVSGGAGGSQPSPVSSVRTGASVSSGRFSGRRGHRRAATSLDDIVLPASSAEVTSSSPPVSSRRGHRRAATATNIDAIPKGVGGVPGFLAEPQDPPSTVAVVPTVAWRDVKSIASDPDQPWNPRLQVLSACDLGWAAAVPLRRPGHETFGLVIYMARSGVDGARLRSPVNEAYLASASDLIAMALLLRGPRHEAVRARRSELSDCAARVRRKLLLLFRTGHLLQDIVDGNIHHDLTALDGTTPAGGRSGLSRLPSSFPEAKQFVIEEYNAAVAHSIKFVMWLRHKLWTTLKKTKGGALQAPPVFSWKQTALTFVGVFSTIAALTWLNTRLVAQHGGDAKLLLGPFGALVTLLYGLTAAPASQPRNAILGQTVAVGVALILPYIPNWEEMSLEWRAALSTATSVAAMVRLGLTHPPAGAAALLFALGPDAWEASHLAVLLLANVIAIGMATFINNLSDRRQYPTFYGLEPLQRVMPQLPCKRPPAKEV